MFLKYKCLKWYLYFESCMNKAHVFKDVKIKCMKTGSQRPAALILFSQLKKKSVLLNDYPICIKIE